jgi:hypothetical protein
MGKKESRDIEVVYSKKDMAAKLRRLADCLERRRPFQI